MAEDSSPVKVFYCKKLNLEGYTCLICGKNAGKSGFRIPTQQGIHKFIKSLEVRKVCNSVPLHEFAYIDIENSVWIKEKEKLKWHANCYASYCSSSNLSFHESSSSQSYLSEDASETATLTTRSKSDLIDLKTK